MLYSSFSSNALVPARIQRLVLLSILLASSDTISWGYDDTLQGQGAGGTDMMIITMPEVAKVMGMKINTNEFAKFAPAWMQRR
jgi:hypothetical protein